MAVRRLAHTTVRWLGRGLHWISRRLFTLIAAVLGLYCLLGIPQVSHLIGQPPTTPGRLTMFLGLVGAISLFYALTLADLVHPVRHPWLRRFVAPVNNWCVTVARRMERFSRGPSGYLIPAFLLAAGLYTALKFPISIHSPYIMAGSAGSMIGLWICLLGGFLLYGKLVGPGRVIAWASQTRAAARRPESVRASQPADASGVVPATVSAAADPDKTTLSAARIDRGTTRMDTSTGDGRSGWDLLGAVLSWLLGTMILGELLWLAAVWELPFAGFRLYTVWGLIHIVVMATVVGGVIDFFHEYSVIPARLAATLLVIGVLWVHGGESIHDPDPISPLSAAEVHEQWMDQMEQRLEHMPDGPVVLVAASGGGSRAALFTALVLDLLSRERMTLPPVVTQPLHRQPAPDTDSGSASTLPNSDGKTPQATAWADHILLISSVSGGSIAAARYNTQPSATQSDPLLRTSPVHTSLPDTVYHAQRHITRWLNDSDSDTDESGVRRRLNLVRSTIQALARSEALQTPDLTEKRLSPDETTESPADWDKQDRAFQEELSALCRQAFYSSLADDVAADFMAPVVRGFLTPSAGRGEGLFQFWNSHFDWDGQRLQSSLPPQTDRRPLVIFNATDIDTGRRLMFGAPPLPGHFGPATAPPLNNTTDLSSEYKPGTRPGTLSVGGVTEQNYAPVAASALGGPAFSNLLITRAVRLSSNFPFGFPVAEYTLPFNRLPSDIQQDVLSDYNEERPLNLRLLDGGVVDNSGLDSLHAVFTSLHREAVARPNSKAASLLAEIRRRGVVLVEIDSGAKPTAAPPGSSPFSAIGRPVAALNNAAFTNAQRANDRFVSELQQILDFWAPAGLLLTEKPDGFIEESDLASAVPAIAGDWPHQLQTGSVIHTRFVCNHITRHESHVMTALALGPKDKAAIIAQFLDQAAIWMTTRPGRESDFRERHETVEKLLTSERETFRTAAARELLGIAKRELSLAFDLLEQARNKQQDLSSDKHNRQWVQSVLRRPLMLLMGVRRLASPGSEERSEKNALFAEWTELNTVIDDLKVADMDWSSPTAPPNTSNSAVTAASESAESAVSDRTIWPQLSKNDSLRLLQGSLEELPAEDDVQVRASLAGPAELTRRHQLQSQKLQNDATRYFQKVRQRN